MLVCIPGFFGSLDIARFQFGKSRRLLPGFPGTAAVSQFIFPAFSFLFPFLVNGVVHDLLFLFPGILGLSRLPVHVFLADAVEHLIPGRIVFVRRNFQARIIGHG